MTEKDNDIFGKPPTKVRSVTFWGDFKKLDHHMIKISDYSSFGIALKLQTM